MKYLTLLVLMGSLAVANRASAQLFYTSQYANGITPGTANVYEFSGGVSTPYASDPSLAGAQGIAIDPSGDVFVDIAASGPNQGDIQEIAAGTGSITTLASIAYPYGSGQSALTGLTYSGGDLYAVGSGIVFKVDAVSGATSIYSYDASSPNAPPAQGLAFSSNGSLYVAGYGSSYTGGISKIIPGGGTSPASDYNTIVASGFGSGSNFATGVAVGSNGDLYVSVGNPSNTTTTGKIELITPAGAASIFATLPTGDEGLSLAFDSAGNLDVGSSNSTTSQLLVYTPAVNGLTGTLASTTQLSGFPGGVAVEASVTVPEPSTWAMLLSGVAGLLFVSRRCRANRS